VRLVSASPIGMEPLYTIQYDIKLMDKVKIIYKKRKGNDKNLD